MEDICLKHDNGNDMSFRGRLFSECSWYDEEQQTLTRQKLFVTEENDQVYYIVRSRGRDRTRHAYRLRMDDGLCLINDGKNEIRMHFDMLMLAVRGICGLEADATPSLSMVEEMLRACNS